MQASEAQNLVRSLTPLLLAILTRHTVPVTLEPLHKLIVVLKLPLAQCCNVEGLRRGVAQRRRVNPPPDRQGGGPPNLAGCRHPGTCNLRFRANPTHSVNSVLRKCLLQFLVIADELVVVLDVEIDLGRAAWGCQGSWCPARSSGPDGAVPQAHPLPRPPSAPPCACSPILGASSPSAGMPQLHCRSAERGGVAVHADEGPRETRPHGRHVRIPKGTLE